MREILFRAWNPIEQEWEYYTLNDLCYNTNRPDICLEKWSQWTGLVDCKGNKIFENDLIKWIIYDNGWDGENFHLNKNKIVKQGTGVVYWNQDHFKIRGCKKSISSLTWSASKEVIGNRFQNPELIKD